MSNETLNDDRFGLHSYGLFEADARERTEHFLTPLAQTFVDAVRASMDDYIEEYQCGKLIHRAQRGYQSLNVQHTHLAPYKKERMVPHKLVSAGRINKAGKPVFYGAEDEKTAVMECRPWRGEILSVATFQTNRDRRILDLSGIAPRFNDELAMDIIWEGPDDIPADRLKEAAWLDLAMAFSRPVTTEDAWIDYLPTQIIAELCKTYPLDGIAFRSSIHTPENSIAKNIALFDFDDLEMPSSKMISVQQVDVQFDEYTSDPPPNFDDMV
jgi:hypothetical protein